MAEASRQRSNTSHIAKRLPFDFCLDNNDVYVGRGSLYRSHPGNQRFHQLVLSNLEKYYNYATNRNDKTDIIYKIVDTIRTSSPNGGFVKLDSKNGHWYEIGDASAREKTSKAFRAAATSIDTYKSRRMQKSCKVHCDKSVCSLEVEYNNSSNSSIMTRKRSYFSDSYSGSSDTFLPTGTSSSNPKWEHGNEKLTTNMYNATIQQRSYQEGNDIEVPIISLSNRMIEEVPPFCMEEVINKQDSFAFDEILNEYWNDQSLSSENCSYISTTSTSTTTTCNCTCTSTEQSVSSQIEEQYLDQRMISHDPFMTSMFVTTNYNTNEKEIRNVDKVVVTSDTMTDEETFNLLLQLYENENRSQ